MSNRLDGWAAACLSFQESVLNPMQKAGASEVELEALVKCGQLLRLNLRLSNARSRGSGGRYADKGFDLLVQEAVKDAGKTLPGYSTAKLILLSNRLWRAVEQRIVTTLDKTE